MDGGVRLDVLGEGDGTLLLQGAVEAPVGDGLLAGEEALLKACGLGLGQLGLTVVELPLLTNPQSFSLYLMPVLGSVQAVSERSDLISRTSSEQLRPFLSVKFWVIYPSNRTRRLF